MRIFHASAANRKKPYDSYTNGAFLLRFDPIPDRRQGQVTKIITIFPSPALQSTEVTISNQKSIANENINPTQTSAWQALQKHFDEMKDVTISELFRQR
ncbi:glucose-6-phosphate isomerase [Klebsiella pneumoniae]|uniref:Glucose-6-phosphate isomerase n=1 Tax=Klebsiella pneumoniae TaxID=573 RepID=A0A2X3DBE9_KLEPN|nr:glucose-6-phosphate isomerase [Klebsiella pneumoniae]